MIVGQLFKRNEIEDIRWNEFVNNSPQQSIYCQSWYLDSICQQWMGIIISNKDTWIGIMPININSKFKVFYSMQPVFAQYLGILFAKTNHSIYKELDLNKIIINKVLEITPSYLKIIDYNFSPTFNYFLPFYWKKFNISPRMSYKLNLDKEINKMELNYSSRIRDDINKSIKNNLICIEDRGIDELLHMCFINKILSKESCSIFQNLWKEITFRDKGFCLYVKDLEGNLHCGGAFIKDEDKVIFILLSTKQEYKRYGSTSLLINEAIKRACEDSQFKYFDFEGSMLESIEFYIRGFNPNPSIYFNIKKDKIGWLFKIYKKIKMNLFDQVSFGKPLNSFG